MALPPTPTSSIISGASFALNPAGLRLPAMPDAKLWCFPRKPGPTVNLVNGAVLTELPGGSSVASGPIYRDAWVDCYGQGIGLETGIADALNGTLICIAKAPGQSGGGGRASAPLIDNSTPSGIQMLLYNYANEFDFYIAGPMNAVGTYHMPLTGGRANCWGFYALTWAAGIGAAGYALTDDGNSWSISSTTNHALGTNTFKISTQPAGAAAGATSESSIAFAGILTGTSARASLSADQINAVRAALQPALAPDGLTF